MAGEGWNWGLGEEREVDEYSKWKKKRIVNADGQKRCILWGESGGREGGGVVYTFKQTVWNKEGSDTEFTK